MFFFAEISQRWGGIVRYLYDGRPSFLVSEPDLIKELLVDRRANYVKNRRYRVLRSAIGNGLLNSEGETWKQQRRATQDALARRTIREQIPWTVDVVAEHLDRWEPVADTGEVHDLETPLTLIVQYLIGCWIFGPGFRGELGERLTGLVAAMRKNWPQPPRRLIEVRVPTIRKRRKLKRTLAEIDALVYGAIHRQRQEETEDFSFLSFLARTDLGAERRRFSDDELRDQLLTLYHAGFETSASLLTFLFYQLALHPEVRNRVLAEVDQVPRERRPTAEDLSRLDYTEWCLNETLRVFPPAYNFTRIPLSDDTLGGYYIPKGSTVIVSPFATHRLSHLWPNPEAFEPERFRPEAVEKRSPFAFIPYGAGPRFCVGAPLAQMQTKIVTALVCQRFRLEVEPGYRVELAPGTVMRPRAGMPMTIHRRSGASVQAPRHGST
jgi:cytochrome P450